MDDSDQDYLTEYRVFFEDFYQTLDLSNPLPVHIGKYNIAEFEITGEIISWCLEYLNYRKCPPSLIAPLCRSVHLEMGEIIKGDSESCGYRAKEDDYHTLKLMQTTIKKLAEVCMRYRDNSKLCCLPPPPPVTPSVSASAAKNIRRTMEDRHIVINDLHALFGIEGYGVASYYAVFDGHNGSDAAIYACSHIYQYLVESPYYPDKPEAAFKEAFIRADDRFVDKSNKENLKSGTTAVCVLIRHDRGKVYVAWLGDSQAILVNGRDFIQLVNPHRPDHLEERERIESMGGSVVFWGTWRVNGQLAVSRSIGNVDYKPYVTGEPDVSSYDLTGDEDFLLLACDGLWDVVSEQLAIDKVYEFLQESKGDRSGVSKSLVTAAKSLGSKDNISVVVAWLDMSTLENGHFGQEAEIDVTDDLLPPVLRNLKPSPQITSAPQRLDESAEKWLKTLPWSYADVLRKPAPKKEEPPVVEPPKEEPALEPVTEEQALEPVTEEVPAAPHSKGEDSGDVAGEADSGEDSDEEWNYISGKENRQSNQQQKEELSEEDMESQLNPNAAEFVPVYSAGAEPDLASSPQKGMERSMEDIVIPNPNDFFKEICRRPSDIGGENETSINGDAMSNLSTKAVFGDDSVCLNSTVDSLSSSEPLKDSNPFAPSHVPNFVQDHFSIPGAQDNFSLPDNEFKQFSLSQQDSKIDFMAEPVKVDLLSPSVPLNDPKITVNESDVSEITFGDGFNVEEILRSKQDSPLLRESPEPCLGPGNENDNDVTPEEPTEKIPKFSSVVGVTAELENVPTSITNLVPGVSSHQGPETSVDSDPEEDDVLVSPLKKGQNGIDHSITKIEETKVIEKTEDLICELKRDSKLERYEETESENELVYHKDEDLFINDETDVCCVRQKIETDKSEVIPEKSTDKFELFEEVVHREQVDLQNEAPEPFDYGVSSEETIGYNAVSVPSKEFSVGNEKNIFGFETNEKHIESNVSEPIIDQSNHELAKSDLEIAHSNIPESTYELIHGDLPEPSMELTPSKLPEQSLDLIHSYVEEPSVESTKEELTLTSSELAQSLVSEPEVKLVPNENLEMECMTDMTNTGVLESNVELREKEAAVREVVEDVMSDEREIKDVMYDRREIMEDELEKEIEVETQVKREIQEEEQVEGDIQQEEQVESEIKKEELAESEIKNEELAEREIKKEELDEIEIKKEEQAQSEIKKEEHDENEIQKEDQVESEIQKEQQVESEIQKEEQVEKLISNEVSSHLESEAPVSMETYTEEVKYDEDISSVIQNVSILDVTSSVFEKPVEEISATKTPINEDICEKKQEVHEELICPIKLSPLTKELGDEDLLETESQFTYQQELLKSDSGVDSELEINMEDSKLENDIILPKKKEMVAKVEDLICPLRKEEDLVYPYKSKEETKRPEVEVNPPFPVEDNTQSYFFGTNEAANIDINVKQEYEFIMKGHPENKIEDSIVLDRNTEKDSVDLVCHYRRTPEEEEIIKPEPEAALQNSSLDEMPITDEMSSSMIDHGEEKTLPEAQSNQLDLVQELQFEVQEKQTEADTESDSGFEIINASEASTIEIEMRYQSEKEAGAVNEKLLMDRNEAEPLDKAEELVSNEVESNLIINNAALESSKEEEIIMVHEEQVLTVSSPRHIPEPLSRTTDLEPLERTELVNGTVTPPATPPATPAPGIKEETKEGLIAAAVAAAGVATAVVAGSAAVAVSESKVEEKKSPIKKTDSSTPKAGAPAKTPSKPATTKASPVKAPTSKPSTPISKTSTPSSKPPAKPSSPTAKTTTALKSSALASKPSTPTSKVGAKPASKPSTPTGAKPAPSAGAAKPKPAAVSAAKPAVSKAPTSTAPAKKPAAPSTIAPKTGLPSAPAKTATTKSTMSTTAAKPPATKPTAPKPAASSATAKPLASKPGATKLMSSTTKAAPATPRPGSAKSVSGVTSKTASPPVTKPPAKPTPAPPRTTATKPGVAPAPKPAAKPVPAKAAPTGPISKKPAAPTAIKKPAAPTDKSTKEASNKLTAKTALNKKIEEKKIINKKEVICENEEPPAQVAIVTTTNGHISLIENGIPSSEIVTEAN